MGVRNRLSRPGGSGGGGGGNPLTYLLVGDPGRGSGAGSGSGGGSVIRRIVRCAGMLGYGLGSGPGGAGGWGMGPGGIFGLEKY